ncbi:hypothetical protein Vafri_7283 [Volvox africanus]|uniref:G-patch domain-containing protein n=1 Tax=Volvox africanus TaxID=51714 RepID=A0A8J4EZ03_9CHLO|nr:hypothetical protein Vafri_7283 [Volvox africanus]
MADAEDEDYHFYGTPLEDEEEGKASAYRRPVKDPAQLRTLPIWKQEATDEQGRKRFHGAFTGGYSAGYYNTVGSAEGFQPATFRSSRSARQAIGQQSVEDFLDEDEREERNRTVLTVKDEYDTFGTTAADAARTAAQREAQQRPSLIPGPVIEELVLPVANGVGMRLLQKLGWRPGRGVGTAAPSRQAEEKGSKWGSVAGVSLENTPLYVLEPKEDLHGLGYDPFAGAEEFRQAAKRRKVAAGLGPGGNGGAAAEPGASGAASRDRVAGGAAAQRRGRIAFGTGALEETDTYGYMEDYVEDDYDGHHQINPGVSGAGRQRPKGLTGAAVGALGNGGGGNVSRNWERLALSFEVVSEGESDDERGGRALPGRRRAPLLLEAGSKGALIPGFLPSRSSSASGVVVPDYFPPPEVPPEFSGRHAFAPGLRAGALRLAFTALASGGGPGSALHQPAAATVAATSAPHPPPPPEVSPPSDPGLRKEIDVLAAMVARSGPALEQIARKQAISAVSAAAKAAAAGNAAIGAAAIGAGSEAVERGARTKYSFFVTGNGLDYYLWRLHKIQTALAAVHAGPQPQVPPGATGPATTQPEGFSAATGSAGSGAQRAAGGRPKHLTIEQRMAMLGEQPLPATEAAAAVAAGSASAAAAPPPRRQVAEADRQHLQTLLNSNFVRGENQYLSNDSEGAPAGLRLGGKQVAAAAEAAAAFLSRFTGGSSSETAVLQPDGAGGLQQQQQQKGSKEEKGSKEGGVAASVLQEPVRSAEDWRPEPLLCRRFNVPDPYKGKPQPQQVSRFRTDLLALPETSNLVISPTATTAPQVPIFPCPSQETVRAPIPPPPPQVQIVSVQEAATSASLMAATPPASAALRVPLAPPVPPSAHDAHFPPPPPLTTPRNELHGPSNLPLPGPPPPPRCPAPPVLPSRQLPPQAAGQPMGNRQLGGHSAADAASAFLSMFGQNISDHTGDGRGGNDGAPSLLPPPPSVILAPAAEPSGGFHAPLPLPPPLPRPPLLAAPAPLQELAVSQQPPQSSQEEDLVVVPLDKPLDLFAAIFEAESDEEEEQNELEGAALQLAKQPGGAGDQDDRSGPATAAGKSDAASGSSKSLAEALMRAQVSIKQEARESRQELVQQEQLLLGGALAAPTGVAAREGTGGSVQAAGSILGPVDPEVQERIRAALSLFQRHHSNKAPDKERKRKEKDKEKQKDKKDKKSKKRKGKDRDHNGARGSKKGRKEQRRSERKTKTRKKEKDARKERRQRKSAKRRRSEREGDDDGGARWEEPRRRGRSKEVEEDKSYGRKRMRDHNHSRSPSLTPGKDDKPHLSKQHVNNGVPAPAGGGLTATAARGNGPAAGIAGESGNQGARIREMGGGLPCISEGDYSSETGADSSSSSSSSEGDSDCSSGSR